MNIQKAMKVMTLKKVMKLNILELLNYKKEIIEKTERTDINNFFIKPKYLRLIIYQIYVNN